MNPLSKKIRACHNSDIEPKNTDIVYIGTNEEKLKSSKNILYRSKKIGLDDVCHIGCSGYYNFDVAYWRKSDYIIIFDINPKQIKFMKHTLLILKSSSDRRKFVDNCISYMDKISEVMYQEEITFSPNISNDPSYAKIKIAQNNHLDLRDEVIQIIYELIRDGSWLSTDASYKYIRKLAMEDKITIFCEDIKSIGVFKYIGELLKTNHIIIDTLYISNVQDYVADNKLFNQSIISMTGPSTLIIKTNTNFNLNQLIINRSELIR